MKKPIYDFILKKTYARWIGLKEYYGTNLLEQPTQIRLYCPVGRYLPNVKYPANENSHTTLSIQKGEGGTLNYYCFDYGGGRVVVVILTINGTINYMGQGIMIFRRGIDITRGIGGLFWALESPERIWAH